MGWCRDFCAPSAPYKPTDIEEVQIVRKRGIDLLHDPLYNKVWHRGSSLSCMHYQDASEGVSLGNVVPSM